MYTFTFRRSDGITSTEAYGSYEEAEKERKALEDFAKRQIDENLTWSIEELNVPINVNNFLYDLSEKETYMGSEKLVEGRPAFMYTFSRDGKRYTVYLIAEQDED